MIILVTGARGFLGKFLCRALKDEGHIVYEVASKECDLTKPGSLHRYNHIAFEQIYHLAAWTQAGDFCLKHPGEQWIINQQINTNTLAWWHEYQPKAQLICMGTSCGYDPTYPLTEENYLKGLPIESLFTYAMTKRMLLAGVMALHQQFGHDYLYLVPSTLYGPDYHTDGRQMHFIFDLIAKIMRGTQKGDPVTLWGDGEQKRELIHVDDFVTCMMRLARTEKNQVINIGAGCEYSIKQFAALICAKMGYAQDKIIYDTTKYVGARSKVLSIDKLRKIYPEFKQRPLEEGLATTIDWFMQSRER